MDVPFNSLLDPDAEARQELLAGLSRVVERGWYLSGPEVEGFEHEFAAWLGLESGRVIGVGNGTDALELAIAALDLPPGARVVTVANAGGYATTAIRLRGLEPLYIDVQPGNGLVDPGTLADALDRQPSAVIVTHLYGCPVDFESVIRPIRERGIPLIEDCAQAHGARTIGGPVGTLGSLAAFSFYPTKNLGALGDAGAVVSGDHALADRVRSLARYGWRRDKYHVEDSGGRNSRMDELQAAALRSRLPRLADANQRRAGVATAYRNALDNPAIVLDDTVDGDVHHLFPIRCESRDRLADWLSRHGIGSAVHYPVPDHLQPAWQAADATPALPVTESRAGMLLSLPCHPLLSDQDIDHVIRICNRFRS